MKIQQKKFSAAQGWEMLDDQLRNTPAPQLVLAFGSRALLEGTGIYAQLRHDYPDAVILINSTSGEIIGTQVYDDSIAVTAIYFERTTIETAITSIEEISDSRAAGARLGQSLPASGLRNVLVISDGHGVNGSDLVQGLQESLPAGTILTGGLAGDGARFEQTLVGLNEEPQQGRIAAIGFYGEALSITYGSVGGWDSFGPERLITKSKGNVLYELDGKPALDIYKLYLGEYADELPGAGLHFPLSIRTGDPRESLVRTILAMNEKERSLTFAGNMPEGSFARLMKANTDRLIEGALHAAQSSIDGKKTPPGLAILISCVGRKLVLNQRVEEEVEVVRSVYGAQPAITGFYSYGEISPTFNFMKCELHNQTMTITTLSEAV